MNSSKALDHVSVTCIVLHYIHHIEPLKELSSVSILKCSVLIYDLPQFILVNLHPRWMVCVVAFLQTSFLNPQHSGSDVSLCRPGTSTWIRFSVL